MDFTQIILNWYCTHKRDLPWRDITDPYKIWVSEIILQQTRIAQGYDYYLRFIKAYPTVDALAQADEDEVLRLWQGLGYYSRARNLHAAAKQVVKAGFFPDTYEEVRKLKGIGDYTAAAICSFAFNLPCAVVDGNVYRVLSRYFGIDVPIDTTTGKKFFASIARELLPPDKSADYNQALMDFGAIQCVPASPECKACPLSASCIALSKNRVEDYPVKSRRTKVKERFFVYVRVETPDGIWLHRRGSGDIWQGLYEYPLLEFDHAPMFEEVVSHPFIQQLPSDGCWKQLCVELKHVLTHRIIRADAYSLRFDHKVNLTDGFLQVKTEDIELYAMPQLLLRISKED